VGAIVSGASSIISSGLSYFKGGQQPLPKSGMLGFGSEDLQRNGGHYDPPGGSYQSSDYFSKPSENKWGSYQPSTSTSTNGINVGGSKTWGVKAQDEKKRYEEEY